MSLRLASATSVTSAIHTTSNNSIAIKSVTSKQYMRFPFGYEKTISIYEKRS